MEYKQHKKLEKFSKSEMGAINEFLEFLDNNDFQISCWVSKNGEQPVEQVVKTEDALYEFLGVDKDQLEKERKMMTYKYY